MHCQSCGKHTSFKRKKVSVIGLCWECSKTPVKCPRCGTIRVVKTKTTRASVFSKVCRKCANLATNQSRKAIRKSKPPKVQQSEPAPIEISVNGRCTIISKRRSRCAHNGECRHGYYAPLLGVPDDKNCNYIAEKLDLPGFAALVCNPDLLTNKDWMLILEALPETGFLDPAYGV